MPPRETSLSSIERRPLYIVKKGDSLWLISKKYGVSLNDLMEENNIRNPSRITVGQKIMIPRSAKTSQKEKLFLFPVNGKIKHYFGEVIDNKISKGIRISAEPGTPVFAARKGTVEFSSYLKGYGNTVIIEHPDDFSTVYANLSDVSVQKGTPVQRGQSLGTVAQGSGTESSLQLLYFEIRRGHKADDPLLYVKDE